MRKYPESFIFVVLVVIAVVASIRLGMVKVELSEVKAATTQENCDYYYDKARHAIEFGSGFGKSDASAASTSTAYSLLYQNCIARNKR